MSFLLPELVFLMPNGRAQKVWLELDQYSSGCPCLTLVKAETGAELLEATVNLSTVLRLIQPCVDRPLYFSADEVLVEELNGQTSVHDWLVKHGLARVPCIGTHTFTTHSPTRIFRLLTLNLELINNYIKAQSMQQELVDLKSSQEVAWVEAAQVLNKLGAVFKESATQLVISMQSLTESLRVLRSTDLSSLTKTDKKEDNRRD